MKRYLVSLLVAGIACCSLAAAVPVSAQGDAAKQIDSDCSAIQNAVMALHPIHVALVAGQWKVMSEGDYAVAEQTHNSITFADVYKQGKDYAWVHSHTFSASGKQTATQLCFRQADGSLERARQASTIPDLSAASAQVGYYTPDGNVIQKTSLFEVNDPAIAKRVKDLAFYQILP
jgi:hypothetical protein